jgi:hypothetical protein
MLGPQLVVLFWEVLEALRGGAYMHHHAKGIPLKTIPVPHFPTLFLSLCILSIMR